MFLCLISDKLILINSSQTLQFKQSWTNQQNQYLEPVKLKDTVFLHRKY